MSDRKLAVVLLSGGLDSCVTAAVAGQDYDLALFHGNYGQRTVRRELQAFRELAVFFRCRHLLEANLDYLGAIGGSSLTDASLAIPQTDTESEELPSTYVPFRNTILIAAVVAWAEVIGASAVFIGANIIDGPDYPDCRPDYFNAYNRLIELGTRPGTHIRIHTPLIHLDKADIIRLGLKLQVPLELTWSCYRNEDRACGCCPSCRIRLKGFAEVGIKDPILYDEENL
ncbi:7-cyano-7-deazaguanine synthase QueC [Desulfobacca acetoxidans]|uniref:7-cyano-7-deazaguanine synthase n=1 Tax=Desulfobacca acetoxidans (strain ATCC 700848 / DSM 11109 / ASRB2) TaxID=880072 RepID=F2NDB5_DESAR|nr:7-cyano-7-deazaguanine synthase QueC [Desulfobacca acetoxidans]AEB09981.1 exsB protein [Desulfobacca acetoxidans DSM 11109]HAY21935.1 7-cyano-7-deazaguanine synthase QueC [Desulfobacterales bacterium]